VDRVLLVHDGSPESSDLFQAVLTMLDPGVGLAFAQVNSADTATPNGYSTIAQDRERARKLGRELEVHTVLGDAGAEIVRLAKQGQYDLIILPLPIEQPVEPTQLAGNETSYILRHAHCRVFLAAAPAIPQEPETQA
jgi:nucleotide-binding universal stress UspA family protein